MISCSKHQQLYLLCLGGIVWYNYNLLAAPSISFASNLDPSAKGCTLNS